MTTYPKGTIWTFDHRTRPMEYKGLLAAHWELELDPMSDCYGLPAADTWGIWKDAAYEAHPDGLIPIYWSVWRDGVSETIPFQHEFSEGLAGENFLTYYTWPMNTKTGKPLNWLTLPVVDKLWRPTRAEKGGFIQEVTGWKPSVLQPSLYLPALEKTRRPF